MYKLIKSVFILEQPDASGNKGFLYNSSGVKKVNTDSYIAIITTIDAPQMLVKDRDGKESKLTVWRACGSTANFQFFRTWCKVYDI